MDRNEDDVLQTARDRFEKCVEHYSESREKQRQDVKFAAASPDDPWQWDDLQRQRRQLDARPCLTINRLPQHIRQVTNDMRMNRPSIRFRAADDKSDPKVAEILMGVVRHIEANSDADIAYDVAGESQVTCGEGYIRVMNDYVREDAFEQDIFIRPVHDPLRVYLDPECEDPTGADARFAFIEDSIPEDEFKETYPDVESMDWSSMGQWRDDEGVKVVEYFEVVDKSATLLQWANGATSYKDDPMPQGVMRGERPVRERKTSKRVVMWRKLCGAKVLEEREFPSRWIGIVRVLGNSWTIDGKPLVSGLVRNAKDSQRLYNVAQSAIAERVMQAPKAPWLAAQEAIAGHEKTWQTANTANHTYLPWNHIGDDDTPIPQPTRVMPATVEPGLSEVARSANDDIKAETGQYDASLGQRSNETSGKAILARQREGDTATYHYVDNLGRAVRQVGRIILDMYPKVYTEARVMQILGEDGRSTMARYDPEQQQPIVESRDMQGAIVRSFNPLVGTYDVYEGSGPGFATRRAEQVEAMTTLTQANPQLWGVIGDMLVESMDWPGAEEMAKRLRATLVPQVAEVVGSEGGQPQIPPQVMQAVQQMQGQMQQLQAALQEAQAAAGQASEQVAKMQADRAIDTAKLRIEAFRAETERMKLMASDRQVDVEADTKRDVAAMGHLADLEMAAMAPSPGMAVAMNDFTQGGLGPLGEPLDVDSDD